MIEMREAIRAVVPAEATEVISYGIPAFRHRKVLVWYAAFTEHCSLFPTAAVIEEFKDELKRYKTAKGTIQFPLREPLPVGFDQEDCEGAGGGGWQWEIETSRDRTMQSGSAGACSRFSGRDRARA